MDLHPIQGRAAILLVASRYRNLVKFRANGHLRLLVPLKLLLSYVTNSTNLLKGRIAHAMRETTLMRFKT